MQERERRFLTALTAVDARAYHVSQHPSCASADTAAIAIQAVRLAVSTGRVPKITRKSLILLERAACRGPGSQEDRMISSALMPTIVRQRYTPQFDGVSRTAI